MLLEVFSERAKTFVLIFLADAYLNSFYTIFEVPKIYIIK